MKRYFQQIRYQFGTQPAILIISVVGTALSITFVILYVMMRQVYLTPFAPESNRSLTLHIIELLSYSKPSGDVSTLGEVLVRECFYPVRSAEVVTAYTEVQPRQISLPGGTSMRSSRMKATDAAFWNVFDFTFISGKPYTEAEFNAALPLAVVDEEVASSLWGTTDVVGRSFELNYFPYRVAGVVRSVSSQAFLAESKIWVPYTTIHRNESGPLNVRGPFLVSLLAKDKKDFPAIREECKQRVSRFNEEKLAPMDCSVSLHVAVGESYMKRDQPYTQEALSLSYLLGTTGKPDNGNILIYLILLLIPSLNLSAMLTSRLRRQRMEIGVRRCFGATRFRIIREVFTESLLVSMMGGILGLALSFVVLLVASERFLFLGEGIDFYNLVTVLFNWRIFVYTLLACVVLNLLSAFVPAWKAVRMNIVETYR